LKIEPTSLVDRREGYIDYRGFIIRDSRTDVTLLIPIV
jgi:hypothetical protein